MRRWNSTRGAEDSPRAGSMVSRSLGGGRRLRHRPDRRGAVEAGVGAGQRRAAGERHHLDVEDLLDAGDEFEVGRPAGP